MPYLGSQEKLEEIDLNKTKKIRNCFEEIPEAIEFSAFFSSSSPRRILM